MRAEVYDRDAEEALETSCETPDGADGSWCAGVLPARAMTSALYLEAPSPNTPPTITKLSPADGFKTRNRKPTIAATVRDAETDLSEQHITLRVDGDEVANFSYDSEGRLRYTSSRLSYGKHTVEVTVRDGRDLEKTESWRFKVKKDKKERGR